LIQDHDRKDQARPGTQLLFESIVREDRNVLDLLNADYTFVDERLAAHYGIPGIHGSQFRRVAIHEDARRGCWANPVFFSSPRSPTELPR
jgi:Protein of unknown function (DUF1592)